jgi:hypothetical protein
VIFADDIGEVEAPFDFIPPAEIRTTVPFLEEPLPREVEIHVIRDESILKSFVFNVLPATLPPPALEPGAVFSQFVESQLALHQELAQVDCESVAATDEAGFQGPEAPEHLDDEFIRSDCDNLRESSADIAPDLESLLALLEELDTLAREQGNDQDIQFVTDLLNNLDALVIEAEELPMEELEEGEIILDELEGELIPAFTDADDDGVPATFDSDEEEASN